MTRVGRRTALEIAGASMLSFALPTAVRAQSLLPVHVGASLDDGLTPVLYAYKTGIFTRNGLDVTLTSASSGAALAAAVAGGSVDIAKSALMSLLSAHMHGIDFKLLAGAVLYTSGTQTVQLCALKTGTIASPADLNGKTVIVDALQSLNQMATQATIDRAGGNSSTVRFIELTPASMLGALETGRADAASIVNPILQAVLDTGKVRTFGDPYDAIGKRFLIAGWFCTASFASRNPVLIKRFAAAVREAALYTNSHHDETVPIIAEYAGLDPDVVRKMHRDTNATDLDPREVQPAIDAAYKYKFISKIFDAKELLVS
jgi:NitT/TauT family transport system substrate-binding protein